MKRQGFTTWLTLGAVLVSPGVAHAHLMNTGFGPFYDGFAHLFLTPEDLLPVLGLTLLAGLSGPRHGRTTLFVLPAAWLAAGVAGSLAASDAAQPAALALLTIVLGALAAVDLSLPPALIAGLAVLLGLLAGTPNGAELAKGDFGALGMAGVACALFVVVALLAGQIVSLRAGWARMAARVAGSWIGAVGMLMLGWSVRSL